MLESTIKESDDLHLDLCTLTKMSWVTSWPKNLCVQIILGIHRSCLKPEWSPLHSYMWKYSVNMAGEVTHVDALTYVKHSTATIVAFTSSVSCVSVSFLAFYWLIVVNKWTFLWTWTCFCLRITLMCFLSLILFSVAGSWSETQHTLVNQPQVINKQPTFSV